MRIILASFLSAVVLFFVGFVWWGLLMPVVRPAGVVSDPEVIATLDASLERTGLYFHPDYANAPDESTGPMALIYFIQKSPSMGTMMGLGFGHMFFSAFLASVIVSLCALKSFAKRVGIVLALGLFVGVWADIGNMIWWHHPTAWAAYQFAYDVVSWLLAGVVIAILVRPATSPTSSKNQ